MTVRFQHLKLVGAAGAVALTVGALTAPAQAASQPITYNCDQGNPAPLGPIDTDLDPGSIPATLVAGQAVKRNMSVTVHLNAGQTGLAQGLGHSVKGSITSKKTAALALTIPATPIPPPPATTMDVTATGKGTISSAKAGSIKITTGRINAKLHITGGAGGPINASSSCAPPTDGSQVLGTVTVSKDKSKTKASGSYNAKKKAATLKAKVSGKKFGLAGTGKVKMVLKKGSHKIKSVTGKLNKKGVAKVKVKKSLAKGTYTVTAKFKGDQGLKGSSGKGTFKLR